jgi:hypothetical protein
MCGAIPLPPLPGRIPSPPAWLSPTFGDVRTTAPSNWFLAHELVPKRRASKRRDAAGGAVGHATARWPRQGTVLHPREWRGAGCLLEPRRFEPSVVVRTSPKVGDSQATGGDPTGCGGRGIALHTQPAPLGRSLAPTPGKNSHREWLLEALRAGQPEGLAGVEPAYTKNGQYETACSESSQCLPLIRSVRRQGVTV